MSKYKVETIGLNEKVYESIKSMILNRELIPGQKLVQEDIAAKLGVSRTPILSAFSKLEQEWLVKSYPRRGFYIYEMTYEEKINLFDIRLRLEPLGAKKAAELGSDKDKELLNKMVHEAREIVIHSDFPAFNQHDYNFHKLIMEMSNNSMLSTIISSYNIISLSNQDSDAIDYESSIKGHEDITKAIINGNSEEAEELMKLHIAKGYSRVKGNVK